MFGRILHRSVPNWFGFTPGSDGGACLGCAARWHLLCGLGRLCDQRKPSCRRRILRAAQQLTQRRPRFASGCVACWFSSRCQPAGAYKQRPRATQVPCRSPSPIRSDPSSRGSRPPQRRLGFRMTTRPQCPIPSALRSRLASRTCLVGPRSTRQRANSRGHRAQTMSVRRTRSRSASPTASE